jgi:hypothetical protein
MAEAAGLRDGLLLAQQIGCSYVELQSDCLEVVTTVQDGGFWATASWTIYDECYLYWKDFHSSPLVIVSENVMMWLMS